MATLLLDFTGVCVCVCVRFFVFGYRVSVGFGGRGWETKFRADDDDAVRRRCAEGVRTLHVSAFPRRLRRLKITTEPADSH